MQRSKMILLAAGAGILVGLMAEYAASAAAQRKHEIRTVLVGNANEKNRDPYMQFLPGTCPGDAVLACQVAFSPVPRGTHLVFEQVTASVIFATGGIKRMAPPAPLDAVLVLSAHPSFDPGIAIANKTTLAYYRSGQTPIVQIIVNDGPTLPSSRQCSPGIAPVSNSNVETALLGLPAATCEPERTRMHLSFNFGW